MTEHAEDFHGAFSKRGGFRIDPCDITVTFPNTQRGRLEASCVYLLLCDNARAWNKGLREGLRQRLTSTEIANAEDTYRAKVKR